MWHFSKFQGDAEEVKQAEIAIPWPRRVAHPHSGAVFHYCVKTNWCGINSLLECCESFRVISGRRGHWRMRASPPPTLQCVLLIVQKLMVCLGNFSIFTMWNNKVENCCLLLKLSLFSSLEETSKHSATTLWGNKVWEPLPLRILGGKNSGWVRS